MKIGIFADTHDDIISLCKALYILKNEGIKDVIHVGDFCGSFMLNAFEGFNTFFVKGNNDVDDEFKRLNRELAFEFGGKKFFVYHGVAPSPLKNVLNGGYDYIIKGHSHRFVDKIENGVRIINPGSFVNMHDKKVYFLDVVTGKLSSIFL